ncbi:MAG: carboxylate--amine ligase [Deltaproteobacteria bacterium]|nr:carboxylate--amine ligase [Deltaproteobacteria bacterium]
MNLLFISPHFPPQFHMFCAALRRHGVRVLGLGDAPAHELRPELHAALTDYEGLRDLGDDDGVHRAVALLISRHGRLGAVESLNEHWLPLEARLREDFNVPGPRPAQMARERSKSGMKALFQAAGVPCSPGEAYTTPERLRAFAGEHGFPLILKPDTGVGAAGTCKVANPRALEDVLARDQRGMFVEKWVDGELLSYDGITAADGRIVFATAATYSAGVMELLTEQRNVAYHTLRELPPGMEDHGRRMVAAFNLQARFFHMEMFRLADGNWCALEANLRPPGGFSTDIMNYATDADVYDLWARVKAGADLPAAPPERRWLAAHVSRRRSRRYARAHDEVVQLTGDALMYWREMPPVLAGAMGDLMYLVRYAEPGPLRDAIAAIHAGGPHPCFPWEQ